MTGATCEPGNPYAIPVMVTGLVPLFLMSSRSTILPFGVSFDVGATSGRYIAFPFCTGSTLMLRLGADIRLPPKIFVVQLSYFFLEAYKAPPLVAFSMVVVRRQLADDIGRHLAVRFRIAYEDVFAFLEVFALRWLLLCPIFGVGGNGEGVSDSLVILDLD